MWQILLGILMLCSTANAALVVNPVTGRLDSAGTTFTNITESGSNVGINTVSPGATLEVNGGLLVDGNIYSTSLTVGGTGVSYVTSSFGIGTISPSTTLDVQAPVGTNIARFGIGNSSSILIDQNGHIGIGTTSIGNLALAVKGANVGIGTTTASAALAVLPAINVMTTNGANVALNMYADSTGGFIEGKVSGSNKVVISTKGISYINTGFNVGIGTSAPIELLQVDGGIYPKGGNYYSADHSVGVTVSACTSFKNGLCVSGT